MRRRDRSWGPEQTLMAAARTPAQANGAAEPDRRLLKMSELAERSGVSPGTIRYYPPEYVERIALIKRLQEERFMPLRVIRGALEQDPERVRALIELQDRIFE